MSDIIFHILAILAIASAVVAVGTSIPRRAAVALAAALYCVAGLFVLLDALIVAVVLAVAVCAGLLMLRRFAAATPEAVERGAGKSASRRFPAMIVSVAIGAILITVAWTTLPWREATPAVIAEAGTPGAFGSMLIGDDVLPALIALLTIPVAIAGIAVLPWRQVRR